MISSIVKQLIFPYYHLGPLHLHKEEEMIFSPTAIKYNKASTVCIIFGIYSAYRKISNISRTKPQNLTDFRLVSQLPLPNPFKSGVESTIKM